jgi:LuxR family maltose regulon positive regulatory protein
LAGDQPLQIISEAHLGLARVLYEWNDLERAERHGRQALELARQYESVIDRFVSCEVFLARLKLAHGDVTGAMTLLARADQAARQRGFVHRNPEVAAARVRAFLQQNDLAAAGRLADSHALPFSQARVRLAGKDPSAALAALGPVRQQAEAKGWADQKLKVSILEALAYHLLGKADEAFRLLDEVLAMAGQGGFVRIFVDEGPLMARLLYQALSQSVDPQAIRRLLHEFPVSEPKPPAATKETHPDSEWIEPLSEREVEVLQHIAEGLTNQEIADRLYLSLHTIKTHARNIFGKLGVKNRTQAVAKGKALGILCEP